MLASHTGPQKPASSVPVTPSLADTGASIDDVSVTGTPTALPSLAAGPNGIVVTAHPANTGNVRVGWSDTTTTRGQPLPAGIGMIWSASNASALYVVLEGGASGKVCVSAV